MDSLISNIERRFDNKTVLASFDIYNPSKLPQLSDTSCAEDVQLFSEYGNDDVERLATQFQDVVAEPIACIEEWSSFKQFMKENWIGMKQKDVISKLCVIHHGQ